MLDRKLIGLQAPPLNAEVERGRLRLFCKAIGETDPLCLNREAAQAAGFDDIIAPPTFLFTLESDREDGFSMIRELKIPIPKLLHGAQAITHCRVVCAGERLLLNSTVTDMFDKKNGALQFVVIDTSVTDAASRTVANLQRTLIVRQ